LIKEPCSHPNRKCSETCIIYQLSNLLLRQLHATYTSAKETTITPIYVEEETLNKIGSVLN